MSNQKLTEKERDELLQNFINAWGEDSQKMMAIEEMSELIKELCKSWRDLDDADKMAENKHNICSEIADVLITVGQMRRIYGAEEVDDIMDYKLKRGAKRLAEHMEKSK